MRCVRGSVPEYFSWRLRRSCGGSGREMLASSNLASVWLTRLDSARLVKAGRIQSLIDSVQTSVPSCRALSCRIVCCVAIHCFMSAAVLSSTLSDWDLYSNSYYLFSSCRSIWPCCPSPPNQGHLIRVVRGRHTHTKYIQPRYDAAAVRTCAVP